LGATIYTETFEDSDAYGTNTLYVFVHDTQETRLLATEEIETALQNQCLTAIEVFWYQEEDTEAPLLIRISEYPSGEDPFVAFFASDRATVDALATRVKTESHRTWIVTHQTTSGEGPTSSDCPTVAD
jgi:hypothetical protein